ncbi:MAG: hypothetical protein K2M04_05800 [Muribaculaceae bacterium]|nr:hypothetical protein [Muribaculaceae bacterium]
MASKRNIKKNIRLVCGDIAGECIVTARLIPGADVPVLHKAIIAAADLQSDSLSKVSVAFDKTPRDFANRHDYNKARRDYYRKAYGALSADFNKVLEEIVKEMNTAVPRPKKEAE